MVYKYYIQNIYCIYNLYITIILLQQYCGKFTYNVSIKNLLKVIIIIILKKHYESITTALRNTYLYVQGSICTTFKSHLCILIKVIPTASVGSIQPKNITSLIFKGICTFTSTFTLY